MNVVVFKCDGCGEGFLSKDDMIGHVNLVHDCWRFQCDGCGGGFLSNGDLIGHVNSLQCWFFSMWCLWRRFLVKRWDDWSCELCSWELAFSM